MRQDSKTGKLVPELFLSASVVNVPVCLAFCHFVNLKCSTIQQDSILQGCQALPGDKEGHPHHKKTQCGINDYKILHKKLVLYIPGYPSESPHILRKPQMPGTNPIVRIRTSRRRVQGVYFPWCSRSDCSTASCEGQSLHFCLPNFPPVHSPLLWPPVICTQVTQCCLYTNQKNSDVNITLN